MKLSKIDRKKFRIRNKIKRVSNKNRFRLSVSRSIKNISAQIIDDNNNTTLVSATSDIKSIKSQKKTKNELSTIVAETLAKRAKEGVKPSCFSEQVLKGEPPSGVQVLNKMIYTVPPNRGQICPFFKSSGQLLLLSGNRATFGSNFTKIWDFSKFSGECQDFLMEFQQK